MRPWRIILTFFAAVAACSASDPQLRRLRLGHGNSDFYQSDNSRDVHTIPSLSPPSLGSCYTDPTFNNLICRVTSGATGTPEGVTDVSWHTPSGSTQRAWNTDSTLFWMQSTFGGKWIMQRGGTTSAPTTTKYRDLTIAGTAEPEFSLTDPDVIYAPYQRGACESTIRKVVLSTSTYTTLFGTHDFGVSDFDTTCPGTEADRTYFRNIYLSINGDFAGAFGGPGQNYDQYVLYCKVENCAATKKLLDLKNATINGVAISGGLTYTYQSNTYTMTTTHGVGVSRDGGSVRISPCRGYPPSPPTCDSTIVTWNVADDTFQTDTANYGGHGVSGFFYDVSNPNGSGGFEWVRRLLATPNTGVVQLISSFPSPNVFCQSSHATWNNATAADPLKPVIAAHFRTTNTSVCPTQPAWTEWDGEILGIYTDAARNPRRFAHHRSLLLDPFLFRRTPRPNVSPDGRWVIFASDFKAGPTGPNYDDGPGLGTDPWDSNLPRTDVFLVYLR
jgi:hypothetical protein